LQHCTQYKKHRCQPIEADKENVVIYDEIWQLQHCMQHKKHHCQPTEADKENMVIYDKIWQLL